jgi:CRP/FNR family transcriptional regulator, cyclic AMP receptor protein
MTPAAKILSTVEGFAKLSNEELEVIATIANPVKYELGVHVVNEGDQSDELFIIFKGQVSIDFQSYSGQKVNICRIGEQQLFGELSYLDNQPRSASATTTEEAKILVLKRIDLDLCFSEFPTIGYKVMSELAQLVTRKLRFTNFALKDKVS